LILPESHNHKKMHTTKKTQNHGFTHTQVTKTYSLIFSCLENIMKIVLTHTKYKKTYVH